MCDCVSYTTRLASGGQANLPTSPTHAPVHSCAPGGINVVVGRHKATMHAQDEFGPGDEHGLGSMPQRARGEAIVSATARALGRVRRKGARDARNRAETTTSICDRDLGVRARELQPSRAEGPLLSFARGVVRDDALRVWAGDRLGRG
ncbi:hypothetical protein FKP32DRAFT_1592680 [Trametes sanguinea]|nr:hypothetical protein FKP32DRAFT_1592680 [Trametes sanguinea]